MKKGWFVALLMAALSACGYNPFQALQDAIDQANNSSSQLADKVVLAGKVSAPVAPAASPLASYEPLLSVGPLSGAHVNVCMPNGAGGWQVVPGTSTVLAGGDGSFKVNLAYINVPANQPLVVCVSAPSGGTTLLGTPIDSSSLPKASNEVATVTVNVDQNTTIVSKFICNQATLTYSAAKGCELSSTERSQIMNLLNNYWNQTAMAPDLNAMSSVYSSIMGTNISPTPIRSWFETWGTSHGFTGTWFDDALADAENFPAISLPDLPSTNTNGTVMVNPVGTTCSSFESCQVCSIKACVAAVGSNTCQSWYETSDGGKFACAACGDCTAAAQAVVNHCCPPPQ